MIRHLVGVVVLNEGVEDLRGLLNRVDKLLSWVRREAVICLLVVPKLVIEHLHSTSVGGDGQLLREGDIELVGQILRCLLVLLVLQEG